MRPSIITAVAVLSALCSIVSASPTYTTTCASANDCTYSFTGGTGSQTGIKLAASAEFVYTNNNTLTITVTNTGSASSGSQYSNGDMIGAIFFGTTSLGNITEGTATASETVDQGERAIAPGCTSTTDISCGYVFDDSTTDSSLKWNVKVGNNTYTLVNGIASIGFSLFSPNSNFRPNTGDPVQGVNNGIPIAPSDVVGKANGGLNKEPIVVDQAKFVLNVGANFNLKSEIGPVGFQYGTQLGETYYVDTAPPPQYPPPVPEPSFVGLLGLGIPGILLTARRRPRKQVRTSSTV